MVAARMADSGSGGAGKDAGSSARLPNLTMPGLTAVGGVEERRILLGNEVADEFERFFAGLEEYVPTIPDELTNTVLAKSGFHCPDIRV